MGYLLKFVNEMIAATVKYNARATYDMAKIYVSLLLANFWERMHVILSLQAVVIFVRGLIIGRYVPVISFFTRVWFMKDRGILRA